MFACVPTCEQYVLVPVRLTAIHFQMADTHPENNCGHHVRARSANPASVCDEEENESFSRFNFHITADKYKANLIPAAAQPSHERVGRNQLAALHPAFYNKQQTVSALQPKHNVFHCFAVITRGEGGYWDIKCRCVQNTLRRGCC